jgi:hypothetical protein
MKKYTALFSFLFIVFGLFSQERSSYIVTGLNTQLQSQFNSSWISDLVHYRKDKINPCYISDVLNDLAAKKAIYFSSVIERSSTSNNFSESIKYIPGDATAHRPLFGNPSFFERGKDIEFPVLDREIKLNNRMEFSGEIMQEMTYFVRNKKEIPNGDLIDRMIEKFEKELGEDHFIDRYLNSPSHKKIIDADENDLFGTSMVFVIHKWYDAEKLIWCHDVLLLNVTVFGYKTKGLANKKIPTGIF